MRTREEHLRAVRSQLVQARNKLAEVTDSYRRQYLVEPEEAANRLGDTINGVVNAIDTMVGAEMGRRHWRVSINTEIGNTSGPFEELGRFETEAAAAEFAADKAKDLNVPTDGAVYVMVGVDYRLPFRGFNRDGEVGR